MEASQREAPSNKSFNRTRPAMPLIGKEVSGRLSSALCVFLINNAIYFHTCNFRLRNRASLHIGAIAFEFLGAYRIMCHLARCRRDRILIGHKLRQSVWTSWDYSFSCFCCFGRPHRRSVRSHQNVELWFWQVGLLLFSCHHASFHDLSPCHKPKPQSIKPMQATRPISPRSPIQLILAG